MKIGLLMPFTGYTANPAAFARTAETLGFESVWIPEHPIFPAIAKTPFPGTGGPIPNVYSQMCDPFVALSMAAAATTNLKVATGICLVPNATRSSPRKKSQRSMLIRGADFCSESALDGSARNPNCSELISRNVGLRPPSILPRCASCGPRMKPPLMAST
jgi:hypothetical protein